MNTKSRGEQEDIAAGNTKRRGNKKTEQQQGIQREEGNNQKWEAAGNTKRRGNKKIE